MLHSLVSVNDSKGISMKISVVGGLTLLVLALVASSGGPVAGNAPTGPNAAPGGNAPGGDDQPDADLTVIYSMANLGYIEPCG